MTRKLRPTIITEPNGATHLLPAVDEPRLDIGLAALRWRWLHEKALRWARCPRCRAMPCHACTDRTGTRKPHRARLRLVKECST